MLHLTTFDILKAMGDLKKKGAEQDLVTSIQALIGKGLKRPKLRNEIICQLIKQTTNHPNP